MTVLRSLASAAANTLYDAINAAGSSDDLDQLARSMWRWYGDGTISEVDAEFLQTCIDRRRPIARTVQTAPGRTLGKLVARIGSRWKSRQHPRSPDRKASRDRRRRLGGSSAMPDTLRHHYTEGQRAVLCIIAGEVKHHGVCDLPIDKIAALAGVSRTTVQTTLHEARLWLHIKITERPRPGRKSLTNIVEIASTEWRKWICRGPSAHKPTPIGSKKLNFVSPTKIKPRKRSWNSIEEKAQEPLRGKIRSWQGRLDNFQSAQAELKQALDESPPEASPPVRLAQANTWE